MIDIAWSEFLLIVFIALILIGPKELPVVLKTIGRWVGKARVFAREVSSYLDFHDELDQSIDEKVTSQAPETLVEKKTTKSFRKKRNHDPQNQH